jgi:elongation factor P hydroxylase
MQQQHHYQQLIDLFDGCFAEDFNTRLIKGDDEPIYLPADDDTPYHRIVFAHGFLPAPCTRFPTGVSPAKRVASWWISATGTARTVAMR